MPDQPAPAQPPPDQPASAQLASERTGPLTVVIAPDSFKGSLPAAEVAGALAEGWSRVRPDDTLVLLPQADGGEGTIDAVEAAHPGSVRHWLDHLVGPDLRGVRGSWLELVDGTAVLELAQSSGIPLMKHLDALNATTLGLGQLIDDALENGATRMVIGLGGSASTDGGTGVLSALGLSFCDAGGALLPPGGGALPRLATVTGTARRPDELVVLTDVSAPLTGPTGAAHVFGPQKGASAAQIETLDAGLARLAGVLGGFPDEAGAGAAGGCGYGLVTGLGGRIEAGAAYLSSLTGYDAAVTTADVVLSGEGRFDATSLTGKVVGHVLDLAAQVGAQRMVVAGQVATASDGVTALPLVDLAGSVEAAMTDPVRWLRDAGVHAARLAQGRPVGLA